jgi:hypothetical protein
MGWPARHSSDIHGWKLCRKSLRLKLTAWMEWLWFHLGERGSRPASHMSDNQMLTSSHEPSFCKAVYLNPPWFRMCEVLTVDIEEAHHFRSCARQSELFVWSVVDAVVPTVRVFFYHTPDCSFRQLMRSNCNTFWGDWVKEGRLSYQGGEWVLDVVLSLMERVSPLLRLGTFQGFRVSKRESMPRRIDLAFSISRDLRYL